MNYIRNNIHAVVDALGNPAYLQLTGGEVHDSKAAIDVLSQVYITDSMVLADRGYDSTEILSYIEFRGAQHTIPPRSNSKTPRE